MQLSSVTLQKRSPQTECNVVQCRKRTSHALQCNFKFLENVSRKGQSHSQLKHRLSDKSGNRADADTTLIVSDATQPFLVASAFSFALHVLLESTVAFSNFMFVVAVTSPTF